MNIEFYPAEKLKKEIKEITGKHLDPLSFKVFFFGSRVRGDNFPRADVDIGVEGPKEIPAKIKGEIEEEIEKIPTLYKLDLVDFKTVSPDFKSEALKYIEPIN